MEVLVVSLGVSNLELEGTAVEVRGSAIVMP
jgi:hypothetical protein